MSHVASSVTQAVTIFSANQWSAEFTRHVLVTVQFAWNLNQGGTKKKYQVLYPVETPQKWTVPNRTVPYHAVEKRHMSQSLIVFIVLIFTFRGPEHLYISLNWY